MRKAAFAAANSRSSFTAVRVLGLIFFVFISSILFASAGNASPVTLSWQPNSDADLAGYRIYQSSTPGSYSFGLASPNLAAYVPAGTESCKIAVAGGEMHFVVTAIDYFNNESRPSNEVSSMPQGWSDYRFSLSFRSDDDDAIGAMFRYQDKYNYYRFSWNAESGYRRIVKREKGVFKVLAEDSVPYESGRIYDLDIVADGADIKIYVDGAVVLSATDAPSRGTVALYTWRNNVSYFADAEVVDLTTGETLLAGDFTGGPGPDWKFFDEGTEGGDAYWKVWHHVLRQNSDTYTPLSRGNDVGHLGTYALFYPDADGDGLADYLETAHGSDPVVADTDGDGYSDSVEAWWNADPADALSVPVPLAWRNYTVDADFGSLDDDALGVMFRYQDSDNYYRFTWNREEGYRRLEKSVDGVFTKLYEDTAVYKMRSKYELKITVDEDHLTVAVGDDVIEAWDGSHQTGGVALYSHSNKGACFDNIIVTDVDGAALLDENFDDRVADGWKVDDQGLASYPARWIFRKGLYVQYSDIMTPSAHPFDITKLGSYSFFTGN